MIFHFVEKRIYDNCIKDNFYINPTLETRGFIHSVTAENINIIAPRYTSLDEESVLLVIDETKLLPNIKYEESKGVFYPHIYGKINLDAIVDVLPVLKDSRKNLVYNEELKKYIDCLNRGKIIFLNGVTSTGKTTLSKELQNQSNENFYHISNDIFQNMVSVKFLKEDYWRYLADAIIMMYHTAKLLSKEGKNVIIDGMLLERDEMKNHYKTMKEILIDCPVTLVEVTCPLEECRKRNVERGNREEFQSHEQSEMMTKNVKHDITVNTYLNDAKYCAKIILEKVFEPSTTF